MFTFQEFGYFCDAAVICDVYDSSQHTTTVIDVCDKDTELMKTDVVEIVRVAEGSTRFFAQLFVPGSEVYQNICHISVIHSHLSRSDPWRYCSVPLCCASCFTIANPVREEVNHYSSLSYRSFSKQYVPIPLFPPVTTATLADIIFYCAGTLDE